MPSVILRLLPTNPVTGADFTDYLNGLTIEVHELSLADPTGQGPAAGSASYLAPVLPASPSADPLPQPDANTRITQHFSITPAGLGVFQRNMFAVATAVVEIPAPAPGGEHETADIRLVITRGGSEILHRRQYYNVPVSNAALPGDPNTFAGLDPVSLHLQLPGPGAATGPTVTVPEDGGAPNYTQLRTAIEDVLNDEPGNLAGIADLTLKAARHIAREITWDRGAFPLPESDRSLESMFTGPHNADSDEERDRRLFEGDLVTYYVGHDGEADRLTNFVFAMSAAIWCERNSAAAVRAGFVFPVFPSQPDRLTKAHLTRNGGGPLNPPFTVTAEYFYALTALLPPQVARQQRYDIAILQAVPQLTVALTQAIDDGVFSEPAGLTRFQAARRLWSLGLAAEPNVPFCPLIAGSNAEALVTAWLAVTTETTDVFWNSLTLAETTGHLEIVLSAVTHAHVPLMAAITTPPFAVTDVFDLSNRTNQAWLALFTGDATLLPAFTAPGTVAERSDAFVRNLRRFFDVSLTVDPHIPLAAGSLPMLDRSPGNIVDALLAQMPGFDFTGWNAANLAAALAAILPGEPEAQAQVADWLACIRDVLALTAGIVPDALRFSVTEALWARGILKASDLDGITFEDLRDALRGSVAFDHAQPIWANAGANGAVVVVPSGPFTPINPDGSLTNCIAPKHLSPLGPVAYLKEILQVSPLSTCDDPLPDDQNATLSHLLGNRRGPLGDLLATASNLCTQIPQIDLVNESLEALVAIGGGVGVLYNTAADTLGGHPLNTAAEPVAEAHDAATLFCALPEHSTPATPTTEPGAWSVLRQDFTGCALPYNQPTDIARTYLAQLGSSRFATMRHFRRHITEYVLDPVHEPAEFRSHLWRYPLRHDIAVEYLGLTPEEDAALFRPGRVGPATLPLQFGFAQGDAGWLDEIVHLPVFLDRTCLSYCEFLELWKSGFVGFDIRHRRERSLPDCEPCCLDEFFITFTDPADPVAALKLLNAFIRLWRRLKAQGHPVTFAELADIADVLGMFNGTTANADFIRQLAALLLLRADFSLPLTDGSTPAPGATRAERTHVLAFWVPGSSKFDWAVEKLLYAIQKYAMASFDCACRPPEFLKLLQDNFDALSLMAGFDPANPAATWSANPACTLTFAEVLAKIYASDFQVGELLFLFTTDPQLQGGEPFPLQTANEARDLPFDLPDDDEGNSLFALRDRLLAVEAGDGATLTWAAMEAVLATRFAMPMPPASTRWLNFGQHFFPGILAAEGLPVTAADRRYDEPLAATSTPMWNTGGGPFRHDPAAGTLSLEVGFTDAAVIAKLARIRQLSAQERDAVSTLYYRPRADLVFFSFLFDSQLEAEARLIEEHDESARWGWFQQSFARFLARCDAIAAHLANHVASVTGHHKADGPETALLLLRHLWASENRAQTPWENDNGTPPLVSWGPQPNGGAFHALLGVVGTGMLAEYRSTAGVLRWREVRGGIDAFGRAENAANSPVPTVIPAMNATITAQQLHYAAIRNGFALSNDDNRELGGAEPFVLTWRGQLLIDKTGSYAFSAGAPMPGVELPDFEALRRFHRWRVSLKQGQKTWVLLAHDWPDEEAPADCTAPIWLERGFYDLSVEFERLPLQFDGPEDVCPQTTGFQLKYDGPDSGGAFGTIPNDKLFIARKDAPLDDGFDIGVTGGGIPGFLAQHYVSTLRDMRATYQMAFKALLFADRLSLSATPASDDAQSELGYMLSQPQAFRGQSHYVAGGVQTHRADFDFNLLPRLDNYLPPVAADDMRVAPTPQRIQALFDGWLRLFDYTVMRATTQRSPEKPVWLLFHEANETHDDNPAHLLRHMNVDIRHDNAVLHHFDPAEGDLSYDVTSGDLVDDRWAIRVWRADLWVRALMAEFLTGNIRAAQPFLWASDGPEPAGTANLTRFYRDGCIENGDPRRYAEIEALNNGLRTRGRSAMVAWLTRLNRVPLPTGGFASNSKDLSDVLLMDVDVGLCQKATRIEEATTALQLFVNRARLGLEPAFIPTPAFLHAWERRFGGFRRWQNCKRREIYRENWIDWDRTELARKSEAFGFFEAELRRSDLTLPVPGGLLHWVGGRPPAHHGVTLLQNREPSTLTALDPQRQGLGLLGTPDRHARPSWLSPLGDDRRGGDDTDNPDGPDNTDSTDGPIGAAPIFSELPGRAAGGTGQPTRQPMWFQAAVRLGTRFLRVAAAANPLASTGYLSKCDNEPDSHCCQTCGKTHPALIDEYYFWIEDSEIYQPVEQIAEWGALPDDPVTGIAGDPQSDWHRPDRLPGLLRWVPRRAVHLRWCRVHNGEFQAQRKSAEGIEIADNAIPDITLVGREGDSLTFSITGGLAHEGHPSDPNLPFPAPGFRYDIAPDDAVVLPEVVTATAPDIVGGLPAFPYFGWHCPGAPILPRDRFAMAIAAAGHLATHCRHEDALRWLDLIWNPLTGDNTWAECDPRDDTGGDDPGPNDPGPDDPGPNDPVPIGAAGGFADTAFVDMPATVPPSRRGHLRPRRCCCPSGPVSDTIAARRFVTLRRLDILLDWSDALMRRNTPEAFGQARLLVDTVNRILGTLPVTVVETPVETADSIASVTLACAPLNPRLMCLYDRASDRLGLIHACLNARRIRNGTPTIDMPYFGDDTVRECWKLDGDLCLDEAFWCRPASPYRFLVLVGRAQELAGELRSLGGQLLSAYEKGDAEYLSQLRVMHERQINDLMLKIREDQWRDADWQVQAIEKNKAIALTNLTYYKNLIAAGLLSGEAQYEPLTVTSTTLRTAGNVVEAIGQAMNLIPDPNVGFPCNFITLPPGKKLAMIFAASGTITRTAADVVNTVAGLGLTKDGWDRREDEWQHLVDVHTIEIDKIERERLGALRRRDAALRDLNDQRQTMQNVAEVQDFLRDKFTSHALYLWLQQETAALHARMYELALHCAYQAQRAFNIERGHLAEHFVRDTGWDDLHEGLLAGERLGLSLRRMEKTYHDRNLREYEITKNISLREQFPVAFLQLQATGTCEIAIPEWMYDLDYPGHFMRRIKTLSVSLPCVTGPYTGIHCRMTLLSSQTRVSPILIDPQHRCCDADGCNNGYPPLPEDARMIHSYAATESVVTSVGTDDFGMFELSFQDPRYLPFELAGAVCRIRLELPRENNQFDVDTLRDVVLHLRYTAREGGDLLRRAARECAAMRLPGDGVRLIDARRETSGQWAWHEAPSGRTQLLGMPITRSMLPFVTGDKTVEINRLEVLFEAPNARPSTHHTVVFYAGQGLKGFDPDTCKEGVHSLVCVGDAAWPGFYHGVQEIDHVPLDGAEPNDLGVLRFPPEMGAIREVYLLIGYGTKPS